VVGGSALLLRVKALAFCTFLPITHTTFVKGVHRGTNQNNKDQSAVLFWFDHKMSDK
jgi:hypothetical protein